MRLITWISFLVILASGGFNLARAQSISGCSGSPANLLIGQLGNQANALASQALAAASDVPAKIATTLANTNINYSKSIH